MTIVVRPGYEDVFVREIVNQMQLSHEEAIVSIHGISVNDPMHRSLQKVVGQSPHRIVSRFASVMEFSDGATGLEMKLKQHRTTRETEKREGILQKLCTLRYERAQEYELDGIFPLHDKRWTRKTDRNGFAKGQQRQFFSDLAKNREERPWEVVVELLKVGSAPIAFHYSIRYRNVIYAYRLAHDNDFAFFRPGLLTAIKALRSFQAAGLLRVDLSTGQEDYKHYLTNQTEELDEFRFGRQSTFGWLLLRQELASEKVKQLLKKSPAITRFRHVTLGRLRHILTFAPLRFHFNRFTRTVRERGFVQTMAGTVSRWLICLGLLHPYFYRKKGRLPSVDGCASVFLRPLSLDDLTLMEEVTHMSRIDLVQRYRFGSKCITLYEGNVLQGSVWFAESPIRFGGRIAWDGKRPGDRCLYDIWFRPFCSQSQVAGGLCRLASELTPKGRAELSLLLDPLNWRVVKQANLLFQREVKQ